MSWKFLLQIYIHYSDATKYDVVTHMTNDELSLLNTTENQSNMCLHVCILEW